jgi:hypothetical protein
VTINVKLNLPFKVELVVNLSDQTKLVAVSQSGLIEVSQSELVAVSQSGLVEASQSELVAVSQSELVEDCWYYSITNFPVDRISEWLTNL